MTRDIGAPDGPMVAVVSGLLSRPRRLGAGTWFGGTAYKSRAVATGRRDPTSQPQADPVRRPFPGGAE